MIREKIMTHGQAHAHECSLITVATVERLVRHLYSIETIYHFRCCICNKWWSIADYCLVDYMICPHCGYKSKIEELPHNAQLTSPPAGELKRSEEL